MHAPFATGSCVPWKGARRFLVASSILFSGNAFSLADGKGRFVIPLDMRKQVKLGSDNENRLVTSFHGKHPCATGFGTIFRQQQEDAITAHALAAMNRGEDYDEDGEREKLFPLMDEVNFDDGGRFFLPEDLKEVSGISDAIFFVGVSRYIQMWNPASYEASPSGHELLKAKCRRFLAEREATGK